LATTEEMGMGMDETQMILALQALDAFEARN
jgi:hypothetical protein